MYVSGRDPTIVANAVAAAVHLGPSTALGITVHMCLALLLGIGLMGALLALGGWQSKTASPYLFMTVALTFVWCFNFLLFLPILDATFLSLLPYPATFASKLSFALAGGLVLQRLFRKPRRQRSMMVRRACPALNSGHASKRSGYLRAQNETQRGCRAIPRALSGGFLAQLKET
jgi:hypothetical protein